MRIKELRFIGIGDLTKLCIEHDWFTKGDNKQYDKLFEMVKRYYINGESLTATRLLKIAEYIQQYSEPRTYEILGIDGVVFCLCEISQSVFKVDD